MKKADRAILNQQLRQERELHGWSQRYVAEQIGAERYYLSRWERGSTFPSCHYRQQLCLLFGKDAKALGLLPRKADQQESTFGPSQAVPVLWTIPYQQNPLFIGREALLQRLYDTFHLKSAEKHVQVLAISGLGGIGKTQLAIEYAYRYRDSYSAAFWIQADSHEALLSNLDSLANLLQLPEAKEKDRTCVVDAVKQWLKQHSRWLLILDNVTDLAITRNFLPISPSNHVLLTTRTQITGTFIQRINLDELESKESALLLLRRAKLISPSTCFEEIPKKLCASASTLVQKMDGLPLALDQAGAYLEETACNLSTYINHFQKYPIYLLTRRGERVIDHPESATTTLLQAIKRIEQINPAAIELLRLCAFLHPKAIPEEILTKSAAEFGPILNPIAADLLALDAVIKDLRTFSLLERNAEMETFTTHRLVQAVVKDRMDQSTQRQWAIRAIRATFNIFTADIEATSSTYQRYLPHAHVCMGLISQWRLEVL